MNNSFFTGVPWHRFMEFISPAADRFTILKETLEEAALASKIIDIAGSRHFVVSPSPSSGQNIERRRITILSAHYDRAEGSPGANDNSAGVFLLLETAIRLERGKVKNWFIIFTDKEELKSGESLEIQGAYSLGLRLKNSRMENSNIFSFDACGTGDTLVISTTAENLLKKDGGNEKLQRSVLELQKLALDRARDLGMVKVLLAPTPFSDDAGFIRAGLAAQTITMLPSAECIKLVAELRRNPDFSNALINAESLQNSRTSPIPETWRSLNSPSDSHLRLTPGNFRTVIRFAEALCRG